MADTREAKLAELGYSLPEPAKPVASYVATLQTGNLLYVSGQISRAGDGRTITGHLGNTVSVEDGQEAARICALNILAQAKAALGSLDAIKRCVRLSGYVSATADFKEHPAVINGASDLMEAVLGEAGKHTRSAVGCASLPLGVAVEIDAVFEV